MRSGFLIGRIGVLVESAHVRGTSGVESGARLELRRIVEPSVPKGEGAMPAIPVTFGDPLWRVDIFSDSSGPPGNWNAAHHHVTFRCLRPGRRYFDPSLTSAPLTWLDMCLRDVTTTLATVGADDLVPDVLPEEWDRAVPRILEAVQMYMQEGLAQIRSITRATQPPAG